MPEGGNWKDLFRAAADGDTSSARYHLDRGVDPNFQHPEYLTTPLHEAVRQGQFEIVRILVEEGRARPDLPEELTESTAVDVAVSGGRHDVADYLNDSLPPESRRRVRHVLVTGGARGIGRAVCESLLRSGHRVALTCRSAEVGAAAVREMTESTGNAKADYVVGDLGSVRGARRLAADIERDFPTIDVVVHNAGIWPTEKRLNGDGLEVAFVVNFLAPYILTQSLLSVLERNGPSRIVLVSAGLYVIGKADLAATPYGKDFHPVRTYASTKQCGVFLLLTWARRLRDSKVTINAVHPGVIRTDLGTPSNCCLACILRTIKRFWGSPSDGAMGPVRLAVSEEAEGVHGKYFDGIDERRLAANVFDLMVSDDWEQWTEDFLSRNDGR